MEHKERRHDIEPRVVKELKGGMPPNNLVLVKVYSGDLKTNSGIFIPNNGEWEFNSGLHVSRTGIVVDFNPHLIIKKELFEQNVTQKALDWDTECEIEKGDEVLFDHLEALNALQIVSEADKCLYKLIGYGSILARKRDDIITPINGYCLFSDVKKKDSALEYVKTKTAKEKGKVRYGGKPNKRYAKKGRSDEGVDIDVDDVVLFNKKYHSGMKYYIESDMHWKFSSEKLFAAQRHWIDWIY